MLLLLNRLYFRNLPTMVRLMILGTRTGYHGSGGRSTAAAVVAEIASPAQFAVALLRQGQWPVSGSNVCAMMAWEAAEGGHFINGASRYNPINTTQSMPGDSIFNSVGVRNYPDWSTGVAATLKTLSLGFYDGIRTALAAGDDASAVLAAVSQSPWGTKFEGQCLDWAADFDEQRKTALAEIAAADGAVAQAAPRLDAANKAQAKLAIKYDAMQAEINKARAQLAVFARSLYIVGVEPEIVSKLQTVQSGDPVAYSLLRSYPGLSAMPTPSIVRLACWQRSAHPNSRRPMPWHWLRRRSNLPKPERSKRTSIWWQSRGTPCPTSFPTRCLRSR